MPMSSMAGVKQARQGERMEKIDASKLVIDENARELEVMELEALMQTEANMNGLLEKKAIKAKQQELSQRRERSTLDRYYLGKSLETLEARRDHHLQRARVHLSL